LSSVPSDAGTVLMHADNGRVDHLDSRVMGARQFVHNLATGVRPPPANEAIVAGRTGAKAVRQITPRRARPQDPKDAVEDIPVVHTGNAARLVRQHWVDGSLFKISELVAHDSKLQFRSLNHAPAADLNTFRGPTARPRFGRNRGEADILESG
jgi:hypothetical protein